MAKVPVDVCVYVTRVRARARYARAASGRKNGDGERDEKYRGGKEREREKERGKEGERESEAGYAREEEGASEKEGERGPRERMWREIYPKAPGNHNPRAISIIDSTRFKTPSVDLPLVPVGVLVGSAGGRSHPRARVSHPLPSSPLPLPPLPPSPFPSCGSFYSPLVDGRDDCHVGNLWSLQMPFEIRPIGWAAVDTCHASFATFTSVKRTPGRASLDYSPDNIPRCEINRAANEITGFSKIPRREGGRGGREGERDSCSRFYNIIEITHTRRSR